MKLKFTVREIVECGMLVAFAIVLDLPGLKISIGEGGGSISFTMIPLFILALRLGPLKSFVGIGIVYGILTCILDGWGIATYPFDYLLGYGSIAVFGFLNKYLLCKKESWKSYILIFVGVILCGLLRFVFASISSIVLYEYSLIAACVYNLAYILPSLGASLVVLILLYKPLIIINKKFPIKSID